MPSRYASGAREVLSQCLAQLCVAQDFETRLLRKVVLAADFDRIDNRHDRRIDWAVVGDFGLPSRASRSVENDFANSCPNSICCHHRSPRDRTIGVASGNQQQREPPKGGLFAAGNDRTYHFAKDHRSLLAVALATQGQ